VTEVEINGCRLFVDERGAGAPVVLVHGLGGTAHDIWKLQLPELAAEFRVVAFDLRGSGASEVTPGPYTIDLLVDDVRALVETFGLGRVGLVGHSMGGAIVLSYAARFPTDVLAVVGVAAPVTLPDAAREGLAARAETVEADGMAAVAETVATNGVSPTFREQRPEEFRSLIAMLSRNDPRGYAAQCRALVGLDLTGQLGQISAPALLVSGDVDGVSPPAATQSAGELVPDCRVTIVEDCGHNLTRERPEALAAAAWPFLRDRVR
jgi:3-oxoadipate enol-lactonase